MAKGKKLNKLERRDGRNLKIFLSIRDKKCDYRCGYHLLSWKRC